MDNCFVQEEKLQKYKHFLHDAVCFAESGSIEQARLAYKQAIELLPGHIDAYYNLALLFHRQGDSNNAIFNFQKVVELAPQEASAFHNLGVLYYSRGDLEEARNCFENAIGSDPGYSDAYYGLGNVFFMQQRMFDAIAIFRECLKNDSSNEKVKEKLDVCYKKISLPSVQQNYQKILIVMDQGIGNMVMMTPAIRAIKKQLPECLITVLGRQPSVQVIDGWECVEKVLTEPDDDHYDVGFFSIWSRSCERIFGAKIKKQCKTIYKYVLDDVNIHESKCHLKLAQFFGYGEELPEPFCVAKVPDIQLPPGKKIIALSDTTLNNIAWERKRWPYFQELAHELISRDYSVVLIGGEEEAKRFLPLEWNSQIVNCIGKYNIQETAGLLKKCDMFVGNDSGPAHIAAAVGIKTFVLSGATRMKKNKPLGHDVEIITHSMICGPCQYTRRWFACKNFACMNSIHVDTVLQKIEASGNNYSFPAPKKLIAMLRIKDAMPTIRECLDSLTTYVDEIVIVDNGSTDGTLDVYKEYEKIADVQHTHGFDEGRDKCLLLEMAKKRNPDWIFWLDADEILEKRMNRELAEKIMNQSEYTSVWFKQYHFWRSKQQYRIDGRWEPCYQRTMWKNQPGAFFARRKIHNGLIQGLEGKPFLSDIRLKHYGHLLKQDTRRKFELYRKIDSPTDSHWSGRTYMHMLDENGLKLAQWEEDIAIEHSVSAFVPKTFQNKKDGLRIFAAFFHSGWEDHNLQPALEEFGEVIRYNWRPRFNQYDSRWHWGKKQEMNVELYQRVEKAHREKPLDVFFGYLSGRLISPGVMRAITMMGIPTLNLGLDDKTKFWGNLEPSGFSGPVDIANSFSLCWTSTKDAVKYYEQVGAKAVFMPPGANQNVYRPLDVARDIDVCFVGLKYGVRPQIVEHLRREGIQIQVFGKGWDTGEIPVEKIVELFSRSKITLGIGTVTDHTDVVCIKGRDFEVPMCGGFYLTQYNPELEEFFEIGKEIACYMSFEDLVEKIRYYLAHPQEAEEIRQAGIKRSLAEHTWEIRFQKAFQIMGVGNGLY